MISLDEQEKLRLVIFALIDLGAEERIQRECDPLGPLPLLEVVTKYNVCDCLLYTSPSPRD